MMTEDMEEAKNASVEIAYYTFDREGRRSGMKVKVVRAKRVEKEIARMKDLGYEIYGTRDAE